MLSTMKLSEQIRAFSLWIARLMRGVIASILLCACGAVSQTANPAQLFQEAVAAQQRGDAATALAKYRELLRMHPEANVVRANLGATLADLGRFDEAIEQYRLVLAKDPANRPLQLNLALAYQGKEDWQNAVAELEPLHKADPADPQTTMMLADSYEHLGMHDKAISLLKPLEISQPNDLNLAWILGSALIHAGQTQEGVQLVERVANESSNAEAYLLAGQTRLARSEYDLAHHDAVLALQLSPGLAGVYTLNGMVLEQMGNYAEAEAALRKAIAADPKDVDAHLYLGAILYFKRDLAEARAEIERALQLDPGSAQSRYELALVDRADGRLDSALKNLQMVVAASPGWMQPHVELAALYYRMHRPADGGKERQIVDHMMALQQEHPLTPAP
jgi:tetratricopeptide (TPR) repeat protein